MKWKGLSKEELENLQKAYGPNRLPEKTSSSWFTILVSQFKSPIVFIIFIAAVISLLLGEELDAILITVVVIANVIMGFVQEFSAKRTFESLRKVIIPKTIVIREGKMSTVETATLVPGDVVVLGSGDRVPADGKLLDGLNLYISEAILTGEEEPVEKKAQKDMDKLFMGTEVLIGRGTMLVKKTGLDTEVGKIGRSLEEIHDEPTPLQKKLKDFARSLSFLIIGLSLVIFIIGILNGYELVSMAKLAIILGVAAIPEGLPISVTIILTLGMRRILKKNGLVRKLLSIETLGSTSVICTDKTGTLTEGSMKLTKLSTEDRSKTLLGLSLLNTRRTSLEVAIWDYLKKQPNALPQATIDNAKYIYEEVFESRKKYAMAVAKVGNRHEAFILGAPDVILDFCGSKTDRNAIAKKFSKWADSGLRVVGLIHKQHGALKKKRGFTWLALLGVTDPIRRGVHHSIEKARHSHIKIKMVTGDYLPTALRVAHKIGMKVGKNSAMEGRQLEKISVDKLREKIKDISVFARVSPHHKLKIVEALQANGEVVAMMGDGVNDAPSLKKADIGVVVGTATDVAKESGDLILLDNDFKTIVAACEEGRLIFSNIKKVIGYILSNSFVEMVLIFGSLLIGVPFPLTVVQILWVQLVTDGPPDILLGFEPKEPGLMDLHPKDIQRDRILDWEILTLIFAISITVGLMALLVFRDTLFHTNDLALSRSIVLAIVASIDLIYIYSYKNLRKSIFSLKYLFNNKFLLLGDVYGFVLIYMALYFYPVSNILDTRPFPFSWWGIVLFIAFLSAAWVELAKFISRHNGSHTIQPADR